MTLSKKPLPEYENFVEKTGIQISKATYYKIKDQLKKGNTETLARMMSRESTPRLQRRSTTKHFDKDTIPFKAFDGEGRTLEGKHKYVLLRNSDGNDIYNENGLSTIQCLDFLLHESRDRSIKIFFSFGYDVQQIVCDLTDDQLLQFMHGEKTRWRGYTLQYLPGKIFSINGRKFYDVFPFWQKSFIKSVTQSLGEDAVSQSLIDGKENRGNFAEWDIETIRSYTSEELDLLVRLADHLRDVLLRCDIHLGSNFYGPGAIANYWFSNHRISPPKISDPVIVDVMERGYYGGRFETFEIGRVEPIYEYDINSAYPSVIESLPYLDDWGFRRGSDYSRVDVPFSIWHVEWHIPSGSRVGPFPSRDRHGLISFPANGRGWYWKPEIDAAIALYGEKSYQIIEGYVPGTVEGTPFSWVGEVYEERVRLKENGDPAEWALKLGLNSLYGKTAQRVGTAKYFSLAWAGYITSRTRAKLLAATVGRTDTLVAYATDAAYFKSDAGLVPSKSLGGWTAKSYDRGYFLQSGVYRLEFGEEHKDAYRGFSVKNGIQDLLDQISNSPFKHPSLYQTKFIGHLEAIRCPKTLGQYRLCFITVEKKLRPYRTTKRSTDDIRGWAILDHPDTVDPDLRAKMVTSRGEPIAENKDYIVWNYYRPLLTSSMDTKILENHNDHSDILHDDIGEMEETYPFKRITERAEDIGFHASDDIAPERLGGATGLVSLSHVGNLPIVDEQSIIQELTNNG